MSAATIGTRTPTTCESHNEHSAGYAQFSRVPNLHSNKDILTYIKQMLKDLNSINKVGGKSQTDDGVQVATYLVTM